MVNRVARFIDAAAVAHGERQESRPIDLYGELALDAAGRNDRSQAMSWLARGRESEPPLKRSPPTLAWEMIELQVQMVLDGPEVWVPTSR